MVVRKVPWGSDSWNQKIALVCKRKKKLKGTKCQCLLCGSSQHPWTALLCITPIPWPTDISHGKVKNNEMLRSNGELGFTPNSCCFFLENKTTLKALHLQKCIPASPRTLESLEWSKKMVHTLGNRHLPHLYKPCHKGPKSSVPRCSATAVPLFSWPTPSLVHQASFLCIQDLPIYPKLKWWSPFWNASNSQVTRKGYNQTNGADFSNRACFAYLSPWLTCWQQYLRLHS